MLTIKNNQHSTNNPNINIGDFYGRMDNDTVLYLVTKDQNMYSLVNISTGYIYSDPTPNISKIFGAFQDKFYLITKDIMIIVD